MRSFSEQEENLVYCSCSSCILNGKETCFEYSFLKKTNSRLDWLREGPRDHHPSSTADFFGISIWHAYSMQQRLKSVCWKNEAFWSNLRKSMPKTSRKCTFSNPDFGIFVFRDFLGDTSTLSVDTTSQPIEKKILYKTGSLTHRSKRKNDHRREKIDFSISRVFAFFLKKPPRFDDTKILRRWLESWWKTASIHT